MIRTSLLTGSANGIGAATRLLLEERGERVIGLDLKDADICADLCTKEGRAFAISEAGRISGGTLDSIIACAGLANPSTDAMIAVNYFGTVALIEGAQPLLAGSAAPRVAVISSSATLLPTSPRLVQACLDGDEATAKQLGTAEPSLVYPSTKCAMSRWIRRTSILPEWAGAGILLNGIAPGTVRTAITAPILATEEGRAMLAQATPIAVKDYADPEHIAPLLAFLASAECHYLIGQVIFIDGGKDVIRRGDDVFGG